jgi:pyruvate dehydrogenase E1 component alpha subunit
LIECKTFRISGHSAHDSADYVPEGIKEEWAKRDPILGLQKTMVEKDWAGEVEFKKMREGILAEIDDAVAWALDQPYPDPSTQEDGVYGD